MPRELGGGTRETDPRNDVENDARVKEYSDFCHELAKALEKCGTAAAAAVDMKIPYGTVAGRIRDFGPKQKALIKVYGSESTQESRTLAMKKHLAERSPMRRWNQTRLSPHPGPVTLAHVTSADPETGGKKPLHGMHDSPQKRMLPTIYKQNDPAFTRAFVAQLLVHGLELDQIVDHLRSRNLIGEDANKVLTELREARTAEHNSGRDFVKWLRKGVSPKILQQGSGEANQAIHFRASERAPRTKTADADDVDIDNDF